MQGAYDLQVHVAPDVIERRIDDLDLAKEFLGRWLKGFVKDVPVRFVAAKQPFWLPQWSGVATGGR
jgi:hypothetical protein